MEKRPGHWVLASIGKRVLRPGGRETTDWLLHHLPIADSDVVEFAPGLGTTARDILTAGPASYVGVDADPLSCDRIGALVNGYRNQRVVCADARATGLPDACADIVIGEAMLSMQGEGAKKAIMSEAFRLLRPGGHYAIHELGMRPNDVGDDVKTEIRKALARSIHVNARPLTLPEWREVGESVGFSLIGTYQTAMALLDPRRMLADEGPRGVARIAFNLARKPEARARVLQMRGVFSRYAEHLCGVGLVFRKD